MSTVATLPSVTSGRTLNNLVTRLLTHGSIILADLVSITVAGMLAVAIRMLFHAKFTYLDYASFAPSIVIFLLVFAFSGLYPGIATSPIEEFRVILHASSLSFLAVMGIAFFLREGILSSRIVFALAWVLTIVLVPLCRRFVRGWCSRQPWWGIPTVVIGEGSIGEMMLELLNGHHRIGLRPIAILTQKQFDHGQAMSKFDIFHGDLSDAKRISEEYSYCYAVIVMPNAGSERIRAVLKEVAECYRRVLVIPDLFGMRSLSVSAKDICGVLALEVDQTLNLTLPHLIKRAFDLAVSLSACLLCSPLFILICLAIRVSSPGPIFYGQRRIGKNQRAFQVWKFRSMVVSADEVLEKHLDANPLLREEWERDHKLKCDPRVTWVGRILRKSSLDELPQLWNVISGEMSIVGPRPITPVEIDRYGSVFDQYLRVTPGVTGLWQISGRNNTTYELRIRIDDYYVRNWSLSLDLYILLRTLKTLILSEGAY